MATIEKPATVTVHFSWDELDLIRESLEWFENNGPADKYAAMRDLRYSLIMKD